MIDTLNLDKPLVVGHSLGGAIAMCLALDFPEKIRGLALLAPLTMPTRAPAEVFAGLNLRRAWIRRLVSETLAIPTTIRMAEQNMAAISALTRFRRICRPGRWDAGSAPRLFP